MDDKPCPAPAFERHFEAVMAGPMRGLPMLNPSLGVKALGFRPWQEHWLGVLVTPWFMNLVVAPREAARWMPCGERESRHLVFPAGVFEFIGAQDAQLGPWLACSLFSPMFEFADMATAEATALAVLQGLFEAPAAAAAAATPVPPAQPEAAARAPEPSRRGFLFGNSGAGARP